MVPQNFQPKNIYENLPLEFSLQKTLGLFSGGRGKGVTPPPPNVINRVKNIVNHLIYVSKAYIPNLRPLGAPLHSEFCINKNHNYDFLPKKVIKTVRFL